MTWSVSPTLLLVLYQKPSGVFRVSDYTHCLNICLLQFYPTSHDTVFPRDFRTLRLLVSSLQLSETPYQVPQKGFLYYVLDPDLSVAPLPVDSSLSFRKVYVSCRTRSRIPTVLVILLPLTSHRFSLSHYTRRHSLPRPPLLSIHQSNMKRNIFRNPFLSKEKTTFTESL